MRYLWYESQRQHILDKEISILILKTRDVTRWGTFENTKAVWQQFPWAWIIYLPEEIVEQDLLSPILLVDPPLSALFDKFKDCIFIYDVDFAEWSEGRQIALWVLYK